jgi:hypothetical protein
MNRSIAALVATAVIATGVPVAAATIVLTAPAAGSFVRLATPVVSRFDNVAAPHKGTVLIDKSVARQHARSVAGRQR